MYTHIGHDGVDDGIWSESEAETEEGGRSTTASCGLMYMEGIVRLCRSYCI